jgi:hypothetical protein
MRHANYGEVIHITEVFGDLPCKDPERHKDYQTRDGECWYCAGKWRESLPWVRNGLKQMRYDDDGGVLALLKVPDDVRKKDRRTVVYKDCWKQDGVGFEDYVCEFFGIEIGDSKDPESYPFWHLTIEDKPNLIIPILRQRVCYEPQITECPIYLEIVFQKFDYEIRFCGLDRDLDITDQDLTPLLRARAFLFNQESLARYVTRRRGGPHNVKVKNQPQDVKESLGKRYVELRRNLIRVKRDAKAALTLHGKTWGEELLKAYPILENHPDLLRELNPYDIPGNSDGSGIKEQWEVIIELAARDTIPDYYERVVADPKKRVGADSLRKIAIANEAEN